MPNEETKQNPWLFFADNDLALAEVAIDNIQFTGQVAFLCQQAIEKYLESRYPTDIAFLENGLLPTKEDAQNYLDFAKKVASIIKAEI